MKIDNILFEKSIKILKDLISFKTISGENNSSLINYCEDILTKCGASSFKVFDDEKKRVNLFATLKAKKPNGKEPIILSGHTDVVPVSKGWSTDPFIAEIKDEKLYCSFVSTLESSISFLLNIDFIFNKSISESNGLIK